MTQEKTWYRHMIGGALLTAALVLSACGEPAQPAPPPPPAAEAPAADVVVAPEAETEPIDSELPRPSAIRATTLIGLNVEDSTGENIGSVDDAFVLVANGEVQYVVVTASGMEGMFSDWVLPLPLQAVSISAERNSLIVSRDAVSMLDAPDTGRIQFERDAWPDITTDDWDSDIRNFWADLVGEEPIPTPVVVEPVEEPADEPEADATPTPVAEEEAIDEDEDVTETETVTQTETVTETVTETITETITETEAIDEDEAMDEETDATPTPVAEEEAIDEEDMDVEATPVPVEEVDTEDTDVVDTDTDVVTDDDELMVRVPYAMSLDELLDFEIHDPNGENLGDVQDIVIDWSEGRIKYLALSFGGFLGLGERWFLFPWNELVFDPLNNAFVTNVTEEMLSDAPGIDRDNWPDFDAPNWDSQFHQYWD